MRAHTHTHTFFFFLPCKFNAKCCAGLCPSSLLNVAGGFHHILYRFVVIKVKLMYRIFSILNYSDLKTKAEGSRTMMLRLPFVRSPLPGVLPRGNHGLLETGCSGDEQIRATERKGFGDEREGSPG